MNRLAGKRALITGAARGIGAAIAARFKEEGAEVIVNDLDLERARAAAKPLGAQAVAADVADSASVAAMFAEVGGPLDILINNAGIGGMEADPDRALERQERSMRQAEERQAGGPIKTFVDVTVDLSDEEWQRMLDVHLNGTFYCSREALKIMNPQGSGCIVNMGSIMGTAGGAGAPHYCAAKAGILGFTRALAREVVAARHPRQRHRAGLDRHRDDRAAHVDAADDRAADADGHASARRTTSPGPPSTSPARRRSSSPARCSRPTAAGT